MSAVYDGREAENDFRTYVAQYRQHLEDIRARLAGGRSVGDHEEVDATDHVDEPDVPAGSGEQDGAAAPAADEAPDLYFPLDVAEEHAEDEDTWTASEQDAFFHGLAVYSRLRPDLIASCIPTKTVPDVCAYLGALEEAASYHPLPDALDRRRTAPLAMGMSESWLEWEETQATRLVAAEPDWEAYASDAQRQDTLATYPSDTSDPAREALQAHWKSEDALHTLDAHKLRAISHILRADEAAEDDPSRPFTPHPAEDDAESFAPERSQSRTRSHSSTPSTRELSPKSRRRLQKRLYMRRKRAEKAGMEAVQDAGLLKVGRPKKARPPRKRRRRGRAGEDQGRAGGEQDQDQDGWEDDDGDGGEGDRDGDEESGEDGVKDGEYAHPHRGGTTAPYKARRLFEESGITPTVLAEQRLDLFDGIGVARWLETIRDDPDIEDHSTPPNAVSGSLLATLRDILVDFVTDVAHRAIVAREQEVHFKAVSKAWRVKSPGLVLAKNVEHALEMMDMAVPDRPKKRKRPPDEEDEDEDAEDAEEESGDEDGHDVPGGEDGPSSRRASTSSSQHASGSSSQHTSEPGPDSPHDPVDDLYPMFFRLPRAYQDDPADLMPEDTDEEALERVLDEEEELDAQDVAAEGEYEDEHWANLTEQFS
ncbi:uncharacterized protein SCHCODRAFT_02586122, partial [Schizophyllum commune H4-8]|uniref:uncharacterized protein n=1 Tax=Schizophyllum commune (strain H4-8 / FGSC 9210) TaxID=578458 RepID=UPI00215FE71E